MAVAVPYLILAAATVSAVGAVRQGQAASNAANYNAEVASQNAQAMSAQGEAASEQLTRTTEQRQGAAMAAYGASGVQMGEGSPMDVMQSNVRAATLDNLTSQYNYKMRGLGYQDSAALMSSQASNDTTAGYLSGMGALFQGAGTAIPKFGV